MIGRLFEDALVAVRFGWFYRQSGKEMKSVGFVQTPTARKERLKYAWNRATFK